MNDARPFVCRGYGRTLHIDPPAFADWGPREAAEEFVRAVINLPEADADDDIYVEVRRGDDVTDWMVSFEVTNDVRARPARLAPKGEP